MRIFAAIATIALSLSGCSSPDESPGNPETFTRIDGLTSCVSLQSEFDQFVITHDGAEQGSTRREAALAYMNATFDRMETLGCPG